MLDLLERLGRSRGRQPKPQETRRNGQTAGLPRASEAEGLWAEFTRLSGSDGEAGRRRRERSGRRLPLRARASQPGVGLCSASRRADGAAKARRTLGILLTELRQRVDDGAGVPCTSWLHLARFLRRSHPRDSCASSSRRTVCTRHRAAQRDCCSYRWPPPRTRRARHFRDR